ncbi:MAG: TerC family protein [Crocinitomicaceae bacterium]|nr:TerC family protein [Crocinitomicaceae bacterium]
MAIDFSIFSEGHTWVALLTLIFLEIILGVDNIIFISIVSSKLPKEQQAKARTIGLMMALVFRVLLLMGITYIIKLTEPVFTIDFLGFVQGFSWRDLILLAGGLFLIAKSTSEIHHKISGAEQSEQKQGAKGSMSKIIFQIILLDIVFSFDSILTAIGLVDQIILMIIAVVVAMVVMMIFTGAISRFIEARPTLQILALSFLILIGVMLVAEGFGEHVPKGYIYFSVAFSLIVEILNMRLRKKIEEPS